MLEVGSFMLSGRIRGVLGALIVGLVCIVFFIIEHRTPFVDVVLASGRHYDVVSVRRDRGFSQFLRDSPYLRTEAVVVAYYTRARDLDSPSADSEASRLVELGIPLANRSRDSLIAIQSTRTIGPRWSPFVRGRIRFFARKSGETWEEIGGNQSVANP